MAAGLLASNLPSALATVQPAGTSSAGPSCQPRLRLSEPDVAGRRPRREQGRSEPELSAELCAAGTGRCRPFPGQDRTVGAETGAGLGGHVQPPALGSSRGAVQAPSGASRKDLLVLFKTHVLQLSQVITLFFFFFPGIYPKASPGAGSFQHAPGTSIALPSNEM